MSEQRVAVVSGGARGIGLEVARQLCERGYRVVMTGRNAAAAQAAAESIGVDRAVGLALDVTDGASVAACLAHVRERYGRADVLVNNAGVALDSWRSAFEVDIELVQRSLETNFVGAVRMAQAFVPMMRARGYGRVVNVSSQLGSLTRMTGLTLAYRASKAALNALTRTLASELAAENVLVNSACPGWVRTRLGGDDAPRTAEEGARVVVRLATLPDDGPRGGFFQDDETLPW